MLYSGLAFAQKWRPGDHNLVTLAQSGLHGETTSWQQATAELNRTPHEFGIFQQEDAALPGIACGEQCRSGDRQFPVFKGTVYIPAPYSPEKRDSLAAARELVLSKLRGSASERKLGILIGEVKSIESARFGFRLVLKQAPDYSFSLTEDLMKRIKKRFENEIALWGGIDSSHLMAVATFGVASSGLAAIEEIALVVTDGNWVPFGDLNEKTLMDRLNENHRSYIKSLRYNMKRNKPLASFELVDTNPPTALFIHPGDVGEEYQAEFSELIENSKLQHWSWDLATPMPALPGKSVNLHPPTVGQPKHAPN